MADTGLIYAVSCANDASIGTQAWINVSNAVGSNTATFAEANGATSALISQYLVGTFSHGLAASDTIDGVEFAFYRGWSNDVGQASDNSIRLVKNGTISGDNKASANWPASPAWSSNYGGSTDTWGLTLSGADTIGVAVSADIDDKRNDVDIYAMRMTIYYTEAATGTAKRRVYFIGV